MPIQHQLSITVNTLKLAINADKLADLFAKGALCAEDITCLNNCVLCIDRDCRVQAQERICLYADEALLLGA